MAAKAVTRSEFEELKNNVEKSNDQFLKMTVALERLNITVENLEEFLKNTLVTQKEGIKDHEIRIRKVETAVVKMGVIATLASGLLATVITLILKAVIGK